MNSSIKPTLSVWHEGELEVQGRAGVWQEAEELSGMYKRSVPAAMAGFLMQQSFAVLSTADRERRVWANLLAGMPGMIEVQASDLVSLSARKIETRLPVDDIAAEPEVGLVVMDFTRRIRVRINGRASVATDGSVSLIIKQLYGNCSQYIQKRVLESPADAASAVVRTSSALSESQQQLLATADTFFIASRHPEHGADASHRGGKPGFVKAASPIQLSFPDYSGNKMFNTLGNLAVNPAVGLLFVDFASGSTLQISGRASLDWSRERASQAELAQRMLDVQVDAVRETRNATTLRYRFIGYSPILV